MMSAPYRKINLHDWIHKVCTPEEIAEIEMWVERQLPRIKRAHLNRHIMKRKVARMVKR